MGRYFFNLVFFVGACSFLYLQAEDTSANTNEECVSIEQGQDVEYEGQEVTISDSLSEEK